jgi:DNA repair photolyase
VCEHTFVRWEQQTVEKSQQARLPGYADAVTRTFDAPEALDIRFHEIHTKSALNRVPVASRVPFEWTINPYRGCTHACVYCVAGDTPILMGDGSHLPLEALRPGDEIFGTERQGTYRRFVRTEVRDHWQTVKPAYRVTLADGTELVASGDHRFLSRRGWKYVTGAQQGAERRPHLTLSTELLGTGRFAPPPDLSHPDYRRGYLCGLTRGDGTLASRPYARPNGREWTHHFFRLALVDAEALDRARGFLAAAGVETGEFAFAAASGGGRAMQAIRTQARIGVERIGQLIRWPLSPSDSWRKGFLAGIFDAEGSCDGSALRMSNTDPSIIGWTTACLRHFGFDAIEEPVTSPNGLTTVRVRGGLSERLRLFHLTAPAIGRRLRLEGAALKTAADRRVVSIEPVGTMRLYDITTGTGDFIANGVVSHNCFARPTHEYLEYGAGRDFEREIIVKVNVPEVLRAELARPSWKGDHVALGTNTDPYQWVEGRYKLMRGIWEVMRDAANPCSILTKSPLVLRDLDLLKEIAEVTEVSACLSVPTLDEKAWRATEPHTPHPRARLEAVAELNRAGIPTGILIAPLMPGVNDDPEQIRRIVELATEAGAVHIGGQTLFLRGSVRDIYFEWLREERPDLLARYEKLYARGAYLPADERRTIERAAGVPWSSMSREQRFKQRSDAERRRFEAARRAGAGGVRRAPARPDPPRERPVNHIQEALF